MKRILKKFRLPVKILRILTKSNIQYRGRLLVDIISVIVRCGILLILYWYVFKLKGGTVNNTTFIFIAWSIFFYFAFMVFRLRDISKNIMQDVQTGNIETLFSKPVSYLSYKMWWKIGQGFFSFITIAFIGSIILSFWIGIPPTMTMGIFIPTLILTFILQSILTLFLYSIVGLLSFWIEDINPVFWIVDKAVMILGGSYLPIALFPPLMKKLALYTPFGASQFITHTVYESWQTNWYQLVGIQIFWIIVIVSIVYFMFKKAKQKVSVNGG